MKLLNLDSEVLSIEQSNELKQAGYKVIELVNYDQLLALHITKSGDTDLIPRLYQAVKILIQSLEIDGLIYNGHYGLAMYFYKFELKGPILFSSTINGQHVKYLTSQGKDLPKCFVGGELTPLFRPMLTNDPSLIEIRHGDYYDGKPVRIKGSDFEVGNYYIHIDFNDETPYRFYFNPNDLDYIYYDRFNPLPAI